MTFPTGWGRKQAITIQSSKVVGSGSHTNFPIAIGLDHLDTEIVDAGSNSALDGGGDIRFSSDSAGSTQLACEIQTFHPDATEGNRRCLIWVKIPSLSTSSDTTIYIWYKKAAETQPAVTDTYGRNPVWVDYEAVLHLNDGGTTGPWADSTGNGHTATLTAGSSITNTEAGHPFSDNWLDFTGVEALTIASSSGLADGSEFGLQIWANADNASDKGLIGNRQTSSTTIFAEMLSIKRGRIKNGGSEDNVVAVSAVTGVTHLMSLTYDSSSLVLYQNGSPVASDVSLAVGAGITGTDDFHIGEYYTGAPTYAADARLGEARIPKAALSADWLGTENNNVKDPSTFAIAGTPENTVSNNPATGVPTISGTKMEGQTLTCDTSGIADADGLGTFSYKWYRDGAEILGETDQTYVLGPFDVAIDEMKCRVSYTDLLGNPESTISAGYGPIVAAPASTYQKCYVPISINPAYVSNAISGDPYLPNFVGKITWDKIPASMKDGGAFSAENGGGNWRVYTSSDLTDVTRLAIDVEFDINAETATIKYLLPILSVSTGETIYLTKVEPEAVQPAADSEFGSDAVALYDPVTNPPADPSDLKTTYDNQTNEADFMEAGAVVCSLIGGTPVESGDYTFLRNVFSNVTKSILGGYDGV